MLKYLFTAIYDDGTILKQTQEDISTKDPKRSAYYDIDHEKLIAFGLESEDSAIVVHIKDGAFEINGLPFMVNAPNVENRRLIYYRRVRINFNEDNIEEAREIEYHIGWQGNEVGTGHNIQRILVLT
jgi:hypothetical protein